MKSPRSEGDERPLPPLILPYIHSLQVLTNHKFKGSYRDIQSIYYLCTGINYPLLTRLLQGLTVI